MAANGKSVNRSKGMLNGNSVLGTTVPFANNSYQNQHALHTTEIEACKVALLKVREALKSDKAVPNDLADSQLIEYLNCVDYKTEKCVEYIKSAYKIKNDLPALFSKRDPFSSEANAFWTVTDMAVFPLTTKEGYRLVYFGLRDPDPSHFNTVGNMKVYVMALDAMVRLTELAPGHVFILNGKGMSLGHVPISQLRFLRRSINYLQEASPVSMKKIHFVNASTIVERTYSLIRPFLKSNITESLFFYSDAATLATVMDPSILPPELGGTLPGSVDLYKEYLKNLVEKCTPYFVNEEEQRRRWMSAERDSRDPMMP